MAQIGKLYLIPNTLGSEQLTHIIPNDVLQIAISLRHFAVEDIKSARRLLRKMDRSFPIDDCTFYEVNKNTAADAVYPIIREMKIGNSVGIISEAGMPCIADPGAVLVSEAHRKGYQVSPMVGPSSILMSLIASGFNGQEFAFHGYLPKERKDRVRKIKDLENAARRSGATQLFMDTPFRNMNVLDDLLNNLMDDTYLCIAADISNEKENIKTMKVVDWRENAYDLSKIPCIFIIGKPQ